MIPAADRERITEEFRELVRVDSESLQEKTIAGIIKRKLEELGCKVIEDDAGEKIGGSSGNIFAVMEGEGSPVLFSAHMDTVSPGKSKEARVMEDGRIVGNGEAVLGADDVAGIVEILEGVRILKENNISHRPVEILLTVSEENFCRGAGAFDCSNIKATEAYVLDLSGPVGKAATQAPTMIMFRIKVTGKAAHAGFEPENGINAIETVSRAISKMDQGRLDGETTFNIGKIEGGSVTNIVPDQCRIVGEVRSYDHEKAERIVEETERIFRQEAEAAGASVEVRSNVLIRAYRVDEGSRVCRDFITALDMIDEDPEPSEGSVFVSTFGGSDNNILKTKGINGIVLSCGMYNVHSKEEYATIEDLEKGARLVAALCCL